MILELIKAAALLLALSLLQGLIVRYWRNAATMRQVLSGSLFGGICVVGMMMPIEVTPGVIFDPRSVILRPKRQLASQSGVLSAPADKKPTRLLLCDLTADTIQHGLDKLLGIAVVDRM